MRRLDTIGSEVSEGAPQLAPADENAGGFEKAERYGPNDALRPCAFFIAIGNGELAFFAQRAAQQR